VWTTPNRDGPITARNTVWPQLQNGRQQQTEIIIVFDITDGINRRDRPCSERIDDIVDWCKSEIHENRISQQKSWKDWSTWKDISKRAVDTNGRWSHGWTNERMVVWRGRKPDRRPQGRWFESNPRLQCTNANSACHLSDISYWIPEKADE